MTHAPCAPRYFSGHKAFPQKFLAISSKVDKILDFAEFT